VFELRIYQVLIHERQGSAVVKRSCKIDATSARGSEKVKSEEEGVEGTVD
jgi:hypothetical protein